MLTPSVYIADRPDFVEMTFTIDVREKGVSRTGRDFDRKISCDTDFVRWRPLVTYEDFTTQMAKAADPDTTTPEEDYATVNPHFFIHKVPPFDQGIRLKKLADLCKFREALADNSWKGARCSWIVFRKPEVATEPSASSVEAPDAAPTPSPAKPRQPRTTTSSVTASQRLALTDAQRIDPWSDKILAKWPVCVSRLCPASKVKNHCFIDDLGRHHELTEYLRQRWATFISAPGCRYNENNSPPFMLDERTLARGITRGKRQQERSPESLSPDPAPAADTAFESDSFMGLEDSISWPSSLGSTSGLNRAFTDVTNLTTASGSKRRNLSNTTSASADKVSEPIKQGPAMTCYHLCNEGHIYVDDELLVQLAKHRVYEMSILAAVTTHELRALGFGPVDLPKLQQMVHVWAAIEEPEKHIQPVGKIAQDIRRMKKLAGIPLRSPSPPFRRSPEVLWAESATGVFEPI